MNPTTSSTRSSSFSHEELHNALLYVEDKLDRALVPFMLFDETAKQVRNELPVFDLEEISIGILRRNWTRQGREIFEMYVPQVEYITNTASFTVDKVPVIMWIVEGDYTFLKNPDVRFYYTGQFYIPNPFREYWKSRDMIK